MNEQVSVFQPIAPYIQVMREKLAFVASQPENAPQSLPGQFYVDQSYFEYECATVLRNGWYCVARTDELSNQGDYLTLQLLNEPLIIVRDASGIKALSNVCRHRGMRLAEGSGNTNRFVCSYHAWMYGTDGALQRAGRMKNEAFNPKTCKLGEFACVERFGFVYVCLADKPPGFDHQVEGMSALIGVYEPADYRVVHSATETWQTNWKCLVENFMEGYHLSVVHPQTLHGYTPTGLSKKAISGDSFTSYYANYPQDIPSRGQGASGLDDEARHRSTLFSVFPCQVASISASLFVSLSILPRSAGEIDVRWTMSVYGDDLDEYTIQQRISLWDEVNREDREKLEIMQNSMASIHATGGPLAQPDYEGTIHDFIKWLAREDAAYPTA